ncbi:MAG TPA: hypothetical protein VKY92_25810 [Verrucomicrobiae bacterium]|nr:hypothetical protein [Verrucomicrobiae bacterium]
MGLATLYFGRILAPPEPRETRRTRETASRIFTLRKLFLVLLFSAFAAFAGEPDPAALVQRSYDQAKHEFQEHPADPEKVWRYARAAFDKGDMVASNSERAEIAQDAIAACKQALAQNPNSAPLHYYLGLNQGELARTRSLGALKLVDQMEREFLRAIELDPHFDYAGAERSLGMLYRDAPALASIGSKSKARVHLQKALELAPEYPENRLNLVESEIKWGERKAARNDLNLLEEALPAARSKFSGPEWAASWLDWNNRIEKARKTLQEPARLEAPRH